MEGRASQVSTNNEVVGQTGINADPRDRVTYASKNDKVKFVCNLPSNSQHLSAAQNLSLEIFTGIQGSSQRLVSDGPTRQDAKLLTARDELQRPGSQSATSRPAVSSASQESKPRVIEVEPTKLPSRISSISRSGNQRHKSTSPLPSHNRQESRTEDVLRRSSDQDRRIQQRHQSSTTKGFKHTSETHETYVLRSGGGRELFASAPIGSETAKIHDQVAARAGSNEERHKSISSHI